MHPRRLRASFSGSHVARLLACCREGGGRPAQRGLLDIPSPLQSRAAEPMRDACPHVGILPTGCPLLSVNDGRGGSSWDPAERVGSGPRGASQGSSEELTPHGTDSFPTDVCAHHAGPSSCRCP